MISIRINIELTILFIINVAPLTLQSKGVFGVRHVVTFNHIFFSNYCRCRRICVIVVSGLGVSAGGLLFTVASITGILSFCFLCRGAGYPDLWPSPSCREPLDVSKNYTFDVISGILSGEFPINLNPYTLH
jgi:hypothetical protein